MLGGYVHCCVPHGTQNRGPYSMGGADASGGRKRDKGNKGRITGKEREGEKSGKKEVEREGGEEAKTDQEGRTA